MALNAWLALVAGAVASPLILAAIFWLLVEGTKWRAGRMVDRRRGDRLDAQEDHRREGRSPLG